jgi:hypothetical protein
MTHTQKTNALVFWKEYIRDHSSVKRPIALEER